MEYDEIRIKYAVINILDSTNIMPVISDTLLELTNETVREYLKKHIAKCFSSEENKKCTFINAENVFVNGMKDISDEKSFINVTADFSKKLFELMKDNAGIPCADVVFAMFDYDGTSYFAMLKMNYKTSFIHYVETVGEEVTATILPQYLALPSESQKVEESVFISCSDFEILLQEKKFLIHDEKCFYLSDLYLNCSGAASQKKRLNTVAKIAEDINKKYYDESAEKKVEFKKALIEEYEEKGGIDPMAVADRLYGNNIEVKNEFAERIEQQGIKNEPIVPAEKTLARKTERQIFKTDTGIEINIPVDIYDDSRVVEFVTNPDGTISIIIKNIANLVSK